MAKQNKELVQEAKALGIDVDGRWSDETIQERIDVVMAKLAEEGQGGEGSAAGGEASCAGQGEPAAAEPADAQTGVAVGETAAVGAGASELSVSGGADAQDVAGSATGVAVREAGAVGHAAEHDALGAVSDAGTERNDAGTAEADAAPAGADGVAAGADVGGAAADGADPGTSAAVASDGTPDAPDGGDPGSSPSDADVHPSLRAGADGDPSAEGLAADDADDGASSDSAGDADGESSEDVVQYALTKPILAAFLSACSVHGVLVGESTDQFAIDTSWVPGDEYEDRIINLVRHAAPFVRQWPEAPVDALYGQVASDGGVNLVLEVLWSELDLPARLAWSTFRDTLIAIDRGMAAEAAAPPADRGPRRVPIDETTLERIEDSFERTEISGGPR